MAEKNYLEIFEMDHFRRIFAQKFDFRAKNSLK